MLFIFSVDPYFQVLNFPSVRRISFSFLVGQKCWWLLLFALVHLKKNLYFAFIFERYIQYTWNFRLTVFSFSSFNVLLHYLLTHIVSNKESGAILILVPLYIGIFFLWLILRFLFIMGFEKLDYGVPCCSILLLISCGFTKLLYSFYQI